MHIQQPCVRMPFSKLLLDTRAQRRVNICWLRVNQNGNSMTAPLTQDSVPSTRAVAWNDVSHALKQERIPNATRHKDSIKSIHVSANSEASKIAPRLQREIASRHRPKLIELKFSTSLAKTKRMDPRLTNKRYHWLYTVVWNQVSHMLKRKPISNVTRHKNGIKNIHIFTRALKPQKSHQDCSEKLHLATHLNLLS